MKEEGMEKLVITAALVGALTMRQQNPNVPYTTDEIAKAAVDAHKAGASMVHLHVRNPETGACVQDADLFEKLIRTIRNECDVIINTTTGGAPGMSTDERLAIIPRLAADAAVKPEMADPCCQ
jgi:3-keto-5-aminohexanoate cleavage enzyme